MMEVDIDALADQLTSAANIVTNDGYYELDTDAVAQCLDKALATTRAELAAKDAEIARLRAHINHMANWITRANKGVPQGSYSFEALGEDLA